MFLFSFATQLLRMDLKSNAPNKLNAFPTVFENKTLSKLFQACLLSLLY